MIFLLMNLAMAEVVEVQRPMYVSLAQSALLVKGLTNVLIKEKTNCNPTTKKGISFYVTMKVQDVETKKYYYVCIDKSHINEKN